MAGMLYGTVFSPCSDNADDLGDDVARLAHLHGIPDAHIQRSDNIAVMQAGTGNTGPGQENRVKHCGGRQNSGAADRDFDIPDHRFLDLGRILEGNGPAREFVGAAQQVAGGQIIDLYDSAVNIERQRAADFTDSLDLSDGILDIVG